VTFFANLLHRSLIKPSLWHASVAKLSAALKLQRFVLSALPEEIAAMSLPSKKSVRKLIKSGAAVRDRILAIAGSLEALKEYNPEQALLIAADIVLRSKQL
jgi:hypothetical protein